MSQGPALVVLRADADSRLGMGHVVRCLALADALRALGARALLVTRSPDAGLVERAAARQVDLRALPASSEDDAAATVAALEGARPDWIVVDHYWLDARWHDAVAAATGARIAVIDDLADRPLHCDVLIDHNLADDHRRKYAGCLTGPTELLGGPRFALLGPAFADVEPCVPGDPVRSIGIFTGGADADGLSLVALDACVAAGFAGGIEVVSTHANPRLAELVAAVARTAGARLSLDLPDLASFFARHDLQIGAGGGASWERCRVGAPTLAWIGAENQRASVPGLVALGAVASLPETTPVTVATLADALQSLLASKERRFALALRGRELVDGQGARRVALRLLRDSMQVRQARLEDAALVLPWRNHPSIRALSRQSQPIDEAAHFRWFKATLNQPDRCLLLGQVGSQVIGVIRFDRMVDDRAKIEVSLYVDPSLQGLSLGSALLRAGELHACAAFPDADQVVAHVLPGNAISRRLFEAAGYHFDATGWSTKAVSLASA